jgi:hypothetical protein
MLARMNKGGSQEIAAIVANKDFNDVYESFYDYIKLLFPI